MLRGSDKRLWVGAGLGDVMRPPRFPYAPMIGDDGVAQQISSWSGWAPGPCMTSGGATAAWPSANRALFVPFRVPYPVVVDKLAWGSGATSGGNVDIGIYDEALNRLVSTGAVARGANVGVITDVTDTPLKPGLYWLAMSVSTTNTMAVFNSFTNVALARLIGMRQMAAAHPLPSTATLAQQSTGYCPVMGALLKPVDPSTLARVQPPWRMPPLIVITPFHPEAQGMQIRGSSHSLSGTTSSVPGQNIVTLAPFFLYERAVAQKIGVMIGATANGNLDAGIYDRDGDLIVSTGSVAQGATSSLQELDITDTTLEPGLYYMAVQLSSATGTIFRSGGQGDEFVFPSYRSYQTNPGSFPLPSTLTPNTDTTGTSGNTPAMGIWFNTLI